MQPNSPLQPLQGSQPKVPGVPQVPQAPDVPEVPKVPGISQAPQTPANQAKAATPKITGVSLPAGSNKKPESPEQRSNKINAANTPEPEVKVQNQNLLHKPVTMEEVEEYRRKIAKKRKIIFASILLLLAVGGITTAVILLKNKQQSYQDLSGIYNDNIPIVIRSADTNAVLVSQSGNKLTDKYYNIEDFESDRSLAYTENEGVITNIIIDNYGNEKYSTENTLAKINQGANYLLIEDGKTYLLDKDGKKVDERPVISANYFDDQEYALVSDDNNFAVINATGDVKIKGILDGNTLRSFSYAHNKFDNNYYCAFVNNRKKESKLYVYNCETGTEITNIEDVYFSGEFEHKDSALLVSEKGSSYFYNNEMIYNSETSDQEMIGGIIKKDAEERYFNPITRKYTESFPTDSLIKQDKLSEKTGLNEECTNYNNREASKLIQICNNIYYNNALLSLNTDKYEYYLTNEGLDDFLAYNDKHFVYKKNKSNNAISIISAEDNKEEYSNITIQTNAETPDQSTSRFIVTTNNQTKTVIDLATGNTAEYANNPSIRLETNYYAVVESTNSGYVARYFNANHKEIYKEEK